MRKQISRIFLFLLLSLIAISCGDGGVDRFTAGPVQTAPVNAGTLVGRAMLRLVMPIPSSIQSQVLANKTAIEAAQHIVAPNGSAVYWPDQPAPNYIVSYDGQSVLTDGSGLFQVTVRNGGPTTGTITHPTDPTEQITFNVSGLTAAGSQPGLVFFNIIFSPCAMTGGAEDFCSPRPRVLARQILEKTVEPNPTLAKPFGNIEVIYPAKDGDPPTFQSTTKCEQSDTVFGGIPFVEYLGSTCDRQVRKGLCPNENRLSDVEGLILGAELDADGLIDGSRKPGFSATKIHCYANHKGRVCQEIVFGELAVMAKGKAVHAAPAGFEIGPVPAIEVTVAPGEVVDVIVHNDGNWGVTNVRANRKELGGILTGPFFTLNPAQQCTEGPTFDGKTIAHFDKAELDAWIKEDRVDTTENCIYHTDVKLRYTAPAVLGSGNDEIDFSTDGFYARITFKPSPTPTPPVIEGSYVGSISGSVSRAGNSATLGGVITMDVDSLGVIKGNMNVIQGPGITSDFSGPTPFSGQAAPGELVFITNKSNGDVIGLIKGSFSNDGATFTGTWTLDDPTRGVKGSSAVFLAK